MKEHPDLAQHPLKKVVLKYFIESHSEIETNQKLYYMNMKKHQNGLKN